jgi:hypothetical protein
MTEQRKNSDTLVNKFWTLIFRRGMQLGILILAPRVKQRMKIDLSRHPVEPKPNRRLADLQ